MCCIMTVFRFNTLAAAQDFADGAIKIMAIVHGDDLLFWVTTPAHAARLAKQGYEVVGYSAR